MCLSSPRTWRTSISTGSYPGWDRTASRPRRSASRVCTVHGSSTASANERSAHQLPVARSTCRAMNFELSQDQELMRETFARFLSEESTMERVRAALPSGFDQALWTGLAELGAFSLRVPPSAGGLGLGLLDAAVLMEEVGRTLASGPIAETVIAAALLAKLAPGAQSDLLEKVLAGQL